MQAPFHADDHTAAELSRAASRTLGRTVVRSDDLRRSRFGAWVARLHLDDGTRAIAKRHDQAGKHRRERDALLHWAAWGQAGVPALLGETVAGGRAALLMEDLPGAVDLDPRDPDAAAVHARAGRWSASLHRRSEGRVGDDPLPVRRAYARRGRQRLRAVEGLLTSDTMRRARAAIERAVDRLDGRGRVACHRDFTPGNWLASGAALHGVIDYEHARADLPEADLTRLATGAWLVRPELRNVFLSAYRDAGGPADVDGPIVHGLSVLEAVGTVGWARRHRDAALERAGRTALTRLLDAGPP